MKHKQLQLLFLEKSYSHKVMLYLDSRSRIFNTTGAQGVACIVCYTHTN
jgi:hypothetical protein